MSDAWLDPLSLSGMMSTVIPPSTRPLLLIGLGGSASIAQKLKLKVVSNDAIIDVKDGLFCELWILFNVNANYRH